MMFGFFNQIFMSTRKNVKNTPVFQFFYAVSIKIFLKIQALTFMRTSFELNKSKGAISLRIAPFTLIIKFRVKKLCSKIKI